MSMHCIFCWSDSVFESDGLYSCQACGRFFTEQDLDEEDDYSPSEGFADDLEDDLPF